MAERLKRAAAWLGLVTDDRYGQYDEVDGEQTEGISRDELVVATRSGKPGVRWNTAGDQITAPAAA